MIITHKNNGFSFVELVAIIAIMAILLAVLSPLLFTYTEHSRMQKDFSTMDELSNAIQLSLTDATVFDEVYEYAIPNNYMTYTDSSGNYAQQIVDAEYWAPDGCANGVTITFNPENGYYDLSKGIVNDMTYGNGSVGEKRIAEGDLKQCYFEEMGNQLFYSSVKQSIGQTLQNTSATYKSSSYTVFIRFYVVDGTRRVDISGAFNGTNLSPDCPAAIVEGTENYTPESKPTTDRTASQGNAQFSQSDLSGGGSFSGTTRPSYKPCNHPGFEQFDETYHQCTVSDCKKQFEHVYPTTGLTAKCIVCEYIKDHDCTFDSNNICTQCGEAKKVIPQGGRYTQGTKTYTSGQPFPDEVLTGDTYVYEDYTYKYNYYPYYGNWTILEAQNGWGVKVNSNSKTSYSEILENINGKSITSLSFTFYECKYLTQSPVIPNSVTNMEYALDTCIRLEQAPVIPNGVTSLYRAFSQCMKITDTPTIPDSVTNLQYAFNRCYALKNISPIPESVTDMQGTFQYCWALEEPPIIPSNVTSLSTTFYDCKALRTMPDISDKITDMRQTFDGCVSLTTAKLIPASVTDLNGTFYRCTGLEGEITINANPTSYSACFKNTTNNIILNGSSIILSEIAATGNNNNVTVQR